MPKTEQKIEMLPLSEVEPDREQPRKTFDPKAMEELAASVEKHGILEPILVQREDGYYKILAGERRWRAACMAGFRRVPAVIHDVDEKTAAEIALVENLQREDLNPIEEAAALKEYCEKFGVSQGGLASILSRDRTTIAHTIRLLRLPAPVQEMIADGRLSAGHGKVLLNVPDDGASVSLAEKVIKEGLSVRELERLVKKRPETSPRETGDAGGTVQVERDLRARFGTKVSVQPGKKKGRIVLEYYGDEDLERLYDLLMSSGGNFSP